MGSAVGQSAPDVRACRHPPLAINTLPLYDRWEQDVCAMCGAVIEIRERCG